MTIRSATPAEADAIWEILEPVIRAGETYALDRDMSREAALVFWLAHEAFVAEEAGAILGTYYLRPNQAGGGGHVCNCGYMVSAKASGRGVARAMCEHSLEQARSARCGCGKRWGSRSSGGYPRASTTRGSAMSMRW